MKTQTLAPVQLAELAPPKTMAEHDGYAALYNVEIDRGWYMLELAPKCFGKSTDDPESVRILHQHDSWQPIGKASNFTEEENGLLMDFLINTEIQTGFDVDSNIRNGVLTGLSVGFDVIKVETEKRGGEGAKGYEVDRVLEAKLREVSVVTFPAIEGAKINASEAGKPAFTTFSVIDGDAPQEHLSAGDRVTLATFVSKPTRVKPNPPEKDESLDDVKVKEALEDATVSNTKTETETASNDDAPSSKLTEDERDALRRLDRSIAEDEKYPRTREALERIINGK